MKKAIFLFAVVALLATMLPVTVLARGGYGVGAHCGSRRSARVVSRYALCISDDCNVFGPHEHDGNWYCNQSGINWDEYDVCAVDGCDIIGLHEHDGTWYHCTNYPDSSGYCGGRSRSWR